MIIFNAAARMMLHLIPTAGISRNPAANVPMTAPRLLTEYRQPVPLPTFPVTYALFTNGHVAPINVVGIRTMAKDNRKTTIAIISLIITVVVIIAAIVKGYTKMEVEGQGHVTAIKTIKTEGCLPARQSKTDIQLMQKDVEIIQRDVEGIKKGVDELLKR